METNKKNNYEMKNKTHKEKDLEIEGLKNDLVTWKNIYHKTQNERNELETELAEFNETSLAENQKSNQNIYSLANRLKKCEAELSATQQVVKIERGDRLRAYEKTLTIIEKLIEN